MLKSMTGFGRYETVTDEYKISVEMKAVNHRYLDLSIKMPKKFNYFEASIRTLLKKHIQRGKVDLFINYEDYTEGNLSLKYNKGLAGEYMNAFQKSLPWSRRRKMRNSCGRFCLTQSAAPQSVLWRPAWKKANICGMTF